jgi:hypothetical protein
VTPKKRPPAKRAAPRRRSAAARQRERRALIIRLVAGATVLLFGGALLYSAASSTSSSATSTEDQLQSGPGACRYDEQATGDPPAGGEAATEAARPGHYQPSDAAPSDAELVKAMRQGFVVLWYRPAIASTAAKRQQLDKLSNDFGRGLILVPRASLAGEVAVTAWHRRLRCQTLDPAALALFTSSYSDKGPEHGFV